MFAPLSSSFLGFDSFFSELERMLDMASNSSLQGGYPPLNLYQENDGGYTIEVAVAGFKKEHIKIEHNKKTGVLSIYGDTGVRNSITEPVAPDVDRLANQDIDTTKPLSVTVPTQRTVLKSGIATRQFARHFTLADNLEVKDAKLEDGMLTISLQHVAREEDKPLLITLN